MVAPAPGRLATKPGESGVTYRTLQRWLAAYRQGGLEALARAGRKDKGMRRFPEELVSFIEGMEHSPATTQRPGGGS